MSSEDCADDIDILLPEEVEFQEAARTGNDQAVQAFIKNKINVNCIDEKDRSALHLAAGQGQVHVMEMLIDADANIEQADKYGMNALLWAAWFGQKAAIETLVKCGARLKTENKLGQTIIHCAAARGHVDVLKYIVMEVIRENKDEDAQNDDLQSMESQTKDKGSWLGGMMGFVSKTIQGGQQSKVRGEISFMEKRATEKQDSKTPLLMACESGQLATLEYLIGTRCNKHARTTNGSTGLHLAAAAGHKEIVRKLLKCELEIDVRNVEGKTPLHMSAENGHAEVVELLLRQKANGNIKSSNHYGAIHFAAKSNHANVIETLAKYRVDFNSRCKNQNAAIHIAAALGNGVAVDEILYGGGNVNAMNEKKRTALHEAVENGFTDVVEKLLIGGVYVPQVDTSGKTALMMAARAENITCVDMIIKAERFTTKKKQMGEPYRRGSEVIQFRKERNEAQRQLIPICWDLSSKHLTPDDLQKLIFFWGFTPLQTSAIQSQFTGKRSWKEHAYRIMLIWLHGVEDNPLKELYESLVAIHRKKLAERVRYNMSQPGSGNGCRIT